MEVVALFLGRFLGFSLPLVVAVHAGQVVASHPLLYLQLEEHALDVLLADQSFQLQL